MSLADEELKKAFQDLQVKMVETKQQIAKGEMVKKANLNKARISELSITQLKEVSDERPVYRAVGRMFVLGSKESELARHAQEANQFREKALSMDKQKSYLEKSVEDSEKNLREMIEARKRD